MCPGCRALLDPADALCPYCGWNVRLTETRREGGIVERTLRPLGGLVPTLVAANVLAAAVVGVLQVLLLRSQPGHEGEGLGALLGAILDPHTGVVAATGAVIPEAVLDEGQWWRLFTSVFLHFGLIHIAMNMMSLLSLGQLVEEAYGSGKALAIYLATGLAGAGAGVGWYLLVERTGAVPESFAGAGASGALCGWAGVLASLGLRVGGEEGKRLWKAMVKGVGFILLIGLILKFRDTGVQLGNAAHLWGFLSGMAFGGVCTFGARARGNLDAVRAWDAAAILLTAGLLVSCGMAAVWVRGMMGE